MKMNLKELKGGNAMKPVGEWVSAAKAWMKKAVDVTFQEGKVLSIRAREAGKLTALNAQKHKLQKEFYDVSAQLGQQVLSLSRREEHQILTQPKVQELLEKARHLETEVNGLEHNIDVCKKDSNDEVKTIYKKAA